MEFRGPPGGCEDVAKPALLAEGFFTGTAAVVITAAAAAAAVPLFAAPAISF
jgi:hypothetical protein